MRQITQNPTVDENTAAKSRNQTLLIAIALLALTAGFLLAAAFEARTETRSVRSLPGASVLSPPKPIAAFSLQSSDGKAFGSEQLRGHWTFVFFGYTYCPDVCPTALAQFNQVQALLQGDERLENTRFLFVSVDPERDSLSRLGEYVRYFNSRFMAATGDRAEIDRFAGASGAVYLRVPGRDETNYLIDHSATVFLYDPEARLHALFPVPHQPRQIVETLQIIRNEAL